MKLKGSEIKTVLKEAKKYGDVQSLLNQKYPCRVKKIKVKKIKQPHPDNAIYDFLVVIESNGASDGMIGSLKADTKLALVYNMDKVCAGRFAIVGDIEWKIK